MEKSFYALIPAFMLLIALTTNSFACEYGCTPGFWKQPQHFGSWNGYSPEATLQDVFGCGGDTTLLEALSSDGGGIYALERHAVAALLNAAQFSCFDFTVEQIRTKFCNAYTWNNRWSIERLKDCFEVENDGCCPLN